MEKYKRQFLKETKYTIKQILDNSHILKDININLNQKKENFISENS